MIKRIMFVLLILNVFVMGSLYSKLRQFSCMADEFNRLYSIDRQALYYRFYDASQSISKSAEAGVMSQEALNRLDSFMKDLIIEVRKAYAPHY